MVDVEVRFADAAGQLADLWDRAIDVREPIRMTRDGAAPVVLVAADKYEGLLATAHLLRSPKNAARPESALGRALANDGTPHSLTELRASFDDVDEG